MEVSNVIGRLAELGVNAYEENGEIIYKIVGNTWGRDLEISDLTQYLLKNRSDTVSFLRRRDWWCSQERAEAVCDFNELMQREHDPTIYRHQQNRWGNILNKFYGRRNS